MERGRLSSDMLWGAMQRRSTFLLPLLLCAAGLALAADKEILLIAGPPSHGPWEHEQNADAMLLASILNKQPGVHATTSLSGWPKDDAVLRKADAIFVFCDGSSRHLAFQEDRPAAVRAAIERGAGLMFYHYAVEPPDTEVRSQMLDWLGGYFELRYSVNPIWEADFTSLPKHPVTNGVKPFKLRDEWYFNMRFRPGMEGVTPLLSAVPPAKVFTGPDGPRSGNADVRGKAGQPACVAWAYQRPDGGRSVGFTGGHYHKNLADANYRKFVLNALVWTAKAKVPRNGVESSVTDAELAENLDPKTKK